MAFNLGDIFVTFKAKAEGVQAAVGAIQRAAGEVKGVTDKVGDFGKKTQDVGQKMTVGLTLPIVGFGVAAFKTAASFEQTMNQVRAATGAPAASIEALTTLAEEMGAKTKFSANEAAQAMLELAKGGITEAQIRAGALDATMTLAAAGGIELGNAAGYVSNSLNTFGMRAEDAGAVAAALAGGANASTASVESLGMALSQVGPGAKLAGYSLQETVAALAAFDNAGVKGSDAGTSLKSMLMGLSPITDAAAQTMKDLGLKFTDAHGQFLPLRDVAEQLKQKLSGLSQEQQVVALKTMFGTDAYRAASILMKEGAAGIDKYTAATSDLGAAQEMAAAMTSGSAGEMEKMMGAVETAMKKVGDTIAPTVIKVAQKIGELADKFAKLDPKVQTTIITIAALVAAAGPLLIGLGLMARGIALVGSGISTAATIFKFFGSTAVMAIKGIGAAMSFLAANPVVLVIMAILLAIAGIAFLIIKNWDTIKEWWNILWTGIISAVQGFLDFIQPLIDTLVAIFTTAFNIILAIVTPIFNAIKFIAQVVFVAIMGIIVLQLNIWAALFRAFMAVVMAIWNAIKGPIQAVLAFIGAIIRTYINIWAAIIRTIIEIVSSVFNAAKNVVVSMWNSITGFIRGAVNGLGGIFGRVTGIISGPFKTAFNAIARLWNNSIGKLSFKAPDWVPGLGGKGFSMPQLPYLAEGGIVDKATLAVIGEGREPEAVIPLSKIGQVAAEMGAGGNGQNVFNLHFDGIMARSKSELRDIMMEGIEAVDERLRAQGKKPILGGNR